MLFSISKGSEGRGEPSYSLRIPFELAPHNTLRLSNESFELLGQPSAVVVEHDQYVLIIKEFTSAEAAEAFLPKACAGLIWVGLAKSFGLKFQTEPMPGQTYSPASPIPKGEKFETIFEGWSGLDGTYDARVTAIVAEHKRLSRFMGGKFRGTLEMPTRTFAQAMADGISIGKPERVLLNARLVLACEVYLASHFESTSAASFLSRITTLEILVDDVLWPEPLLRLVEGFRKEVSKALKRESDDLVLSELRSLQGRVARLRYRSIKTGIRALVDSTLKGTVADVATVARDVSEFYDLRSDLVHNGKADIEVIRSANNQLNAIVPQILQAMFRGCQTESAK